MTFLLTGILRAAFLLLVISLLPGCAPKTQEQYKALSFFFDGVPDPSIIKADKTTKEKKDATGLKERSKFTEHGPFAAKECTGCHQRSTNALIAPVEELCFRCHQLDLQKGWTHGPVAAGGCRICHNPHSSGFPFLLMAKPSEFCYYCHEKKDVMRAEAHKVTTLECTVCHDAHSADNRFLIKKQPPPEQNGTSSVIRKDFNRTPLGKADKDNGECGPRLGVKCRKQPPALLLKDNFPTSSNRFLLPSGLVGKDRAQREGELITHR